MKNFASTNPYRPGTGRMPLFLAGRDQEIKAFEEALTEWEARPQVFLIEGPRGVGKSCLSRVLEGTLNRAGWATVRHDVNANLENPKEFESVMTADISDLMADLSIFQQVKQLGGQIAFVPTAVSVPSPMGEVKVEFEFPGRGKGPYARRLARDIRKLGELAQSRHRGAAIILDEAHTLRDQPKTGKTALSDLLAAVLGAQEDGLPVTVIFVGLPMRLNLEIARTNIERALTTLRLGNLECDDALRALMVPARMGGRPMTLSLATNVVDGRSKGYAWYLQLYGQALWDEATRLGLPAIDSAVAPVAYVAVQAKLDRDVFDARYQKASSADQAVLKAAAALGGEEFAVKDLIRQMSSAKSDQAVRLSLNRLNGSAIWQQRYGRYSYTLPMFGDFLRRKHPFASQAVVAAAPALAVAPSVAAPDAEAIPDVRGIDRAAVGSLSRL